MELQRLARHAVQVMFEQDAESAGIAQVERALQHAVADWEPTYRLLWNGGIDKASNTVERLDDAARQSLWEHAAADTPLPESVLSRLTPVQLDDITYTNANGAVRLTALFRAWLKTIQ
jgi:hypothetical protein